MPGFFLGSGGGMKAGRAGKAGTSPFHPWLLRWEGTRSLDPLGSPPRCRFGVKRVRAEGDGSQDTWFLPSLGTSVWVGGLE